MEGQKVMGVILVIEHFGTMQARNTDVLLPHRNTCPARFNGLLLERPWTNEDVCSRSYLWWCAPTSKQYGISGETEQAQMVEDMAERCVQSFALRFRVYWVLGFMTGVGRAMM